MAIVLYTALDDLTVTSIIATWPCPAGNTFPVEMTDPVAAAMAAELLAAGQIIPAPPDAVDDTTPPGIVRGQPGIKAPGTVSN